MMMKKNIHALPKFGVLLSIIFLLTSCVKELDGYLEAHEKHLVVNSMISPGGPLQVQLNESLPVNAQVQYPLITDAAVFMKPEGQPLQQLYPDDSLYRYYQNPQYGSTYELIVVTSGADTLSATTTIPEPPKITGTKLYYTNLYDDYGDRITGAEITIKDSAETDDFYCFYLVDFYNYYRLNDPAIIAEGILQYEPDLIFFSDKLFNGQSYTLKLLYIGSSHVNYDNIPRPERIIFRSISKTYYDFLSSWTLHRYNQNTIVSDENIQYNLEQLYFKGEPVELYSNISGGRGLFAGYADTVIELGAENDRNQ